MWRDLGLIGYTPDFTQHGNNKVVNFHRTLKREKRKTNTHLFTNPYCEHSWRNRWQTWPGLYSKESSMVTANVLRAKRGFTRSYTGTRAGHS